MNNRHYSQGSPRHPIREVLQRIVGAVPPDFVQGYDYNNLTDTQYESLQSWVLDSLSDSPLYWSTGIGILEAAQNIVEEAVINANIPPKTNP